MAVDRTFYGRIGRTIDDIAADVAAKYRISVKDLKSQARFRTIAWPRQEAMFLAYQERRADGRRVYSLPQIGLWFGGRDHTTALFGIRRHEERMRAS